MSSWVSTFPAGRAGEAATGSTAAAEAAGRTEKAAAEAGSILKRPSRNRDQVNNKILFDLPYTCDVPHINLMLNIHKRQKEKKDNVLFT